MSISLLYGYRAHRDLHSFPTRRSSDLEVELHLPPAAVDAEGLEEDEQHEDQPEEPGLQARLLDELIDGEERGRARIQIGRAHAELQSPMYLVCRLLLEKKKETQSRTY